MSCCSCGSCQLCWIKSPYLQCSTADTYKHIQQLKFDMTQVNAIDSQTSVRWSVCLTWLGAGAHRHRRLVQLSHDLLVRLVDRHEHLRLGGQLSHDVGGAEDTLQVEPVTLTRHPLILQRKPATVLLSCPRREAVIQAICTFPLWGSQPC